MEFTFGRLEQGIDMVSGMNNKQFHYLDKGGYEKIISYLFNIIGRCYIQTPKKNIKVCMVFQLLLILNGMETILYEMDI